MQLRQLHTLLLVILDLIACLVVFNLFAWMRGIAGPGHWMITPLAVPMFFVVGTLYLIDGYRPRTEMMSADYLSQHMLAFLVSLAAILLITFVALPSGFALQGSRGVVALAFLTSALVTLTYRRSIRRWTTSSQQERSLLFIGEAAACEEFCQICSANGIRERIVCAVLGEPTTTPSQPETLSTVRPYKSVMDEIRSGSLKVEAIILRESSHVLPDHLGDELTSFYFTGIPTYTLELFYETYWRKIPLYRINHIWLFQEGFQIARNPVFERTKRGFDIVLAGLGLFLFLPAMVFASLAVKLEDGGPIFFRQPRVGRNRQPFSVLKIRTMRSAPPTTVPAADRSTDQRYTQANDPRITRIGSFLRKSRLDEVPQLWNVLKGDMSLIGPRAEWSELVKDYEAKIPCYHFRHLVRPGITGWAQINYPYGASIEDTLRKLEYDLYYIRHFSFIMDAAIILRTLHLMLFAKGR